MDCELGEQVVIVLLNVLQASQYLLEILATGKQEMLLVYVMNNVSVFINRTLFYLPLLSLKFSVTSLLTNTFYIVYDGFVFTYLSTAQHETYSHSLRLSNCRKSKQSRFQT